ncbi:hypothetical protein BKA70DRAFT_1423776 [Coprinopsis sp. MPI-PUGE-AT-0042]|nr:hypothetical protein BKA70DRAFT_1423776 [Coprinopsis sp. MPI-PUGE-AT-0042]
MISPLVRGTAAQSPAHLLTSPDPMQATAYVDDARQAVHSSSLTTLLRPMLIVRVSTPDLQGEGVVGCGVKLGLMVPVIPGIVDLLVECILVRVDADEDGVDATVEIGGKRSTLFRKDDD